MTFVDTAAWYAFFVKSDPKHHVAVSTMTSSRLPITTTDYVADETLTLFRARGQRGKAIEFGRYVFDGADVVLHYVTMSEISAAWDVFIRFADKDWSFTDCTSKVVIESLAIPTAFTFDHHFRQFGSVAVVP